MKIFRFISILLVKGVTKITPYLIVFLPLNLWFGLPFLLMVVGYKIRRYTTNRVFNYVLQNGVHLPRLQEIGWYYDSQTNSYLNNIHKEGYIKYKKVSKLEYCFALFFWIWIDNDSSRDTTSNGLVFDRILTKQTWSFMPDIFRKIVAKEKAKSDNINNLGKAWVMGDNVKSEWYWISSTIWLFKNTAYGFNYMFEEYAEDSKYNFFKVVKIFGFTTVWGYIPYENSTRKGRLVWLREDLDKIDRHILERYK